jgi:putative DNA methylase
MSTFIETQFPIARLSAESYKERKANNGSDTHWPRQVVGAQAAHPRPRLHPRHVDARLGNPKRDREIFLKILTMDDDGTWQRNKGRIKTAPPSTH